MRVFLRNFLFSVCLLGLASAYSEALFEPMAQETWKILGVDSKRWAAPMLGFFADWGRLIAIVAGSALMGALANHWAAKYDRGKPAARPAIDHPVQVAMETGVSSSRIGADPTTAIAASPSSKKYTKREAEDIIEALNCLDDIAVNEVLRRLPDASYFQNIMSNFRSGMPDPLPKIKSEIAKIQELDSISYQNVMAILERYRKDSKDLQAFISEILSYRSMLDAADEILVCIRGNHPGTLITPQSQRLAAQITEYKDRVHSVRGKIASKQGDMRAYL